MEMAPAERWVLRRQMAAAAGKKRTTSLSLFMEAFGFEVEEDLSLCTDHAVLGKRSLDGKMASGAKREAWMKHVREVQTWMQVGGPAGAVMCETRDLGIKWLFWHTLIFEGDRSIVMRYVCPKDLEKMLLQQAGKVCWKTWAAKHEYEELKEGTWLEPALALMRKKTKEDWADKASKML